MTVLTYTDYLALTRNRFAVVCSKPKAPNIDLGMKIPNALPVKSCVHSKGKTSKAGVT